MEEQQNIEQLSWIHERINDVPYKKKLYKFMKILLFKWKGLTYLEMYAMLKELYKNKIVDKKLLEKKVLNEIMEIYIYNNN